MPKWSWIIILAIVIVAGFDAHIEERFLTEQLEAREDEQGQFAAIAAAVGDEDRCGRRLFEQGEGFVRNLI